MQRILLIFMSLFLTYCGSAVRLADHQSENYYNLDYRKYIEKGFLFCRSDCVEEYEVIGNLSIIANPSLRTVNFISDSTNKKNNNFTDSQFILNYSEVIDSFYNTAVKLGADAVINFSIKKETDFYKLEPKEITSISVDNEIISSESPKNLSAKDGSKFKYTWIELTGLIIKRSFN